MLVDYLMPKTICAPANASDLAVLQARGALLSHFDFESRVIEMADGRKYNMDRVDLVDVKNIYKGQRIVEAAKRLAICNTGCIFVDLEDARDIPLASYGITANCIQYNRNVRDPYAALFPLLSYIVPSSNGLGHVNTSAITDDLSFYNKKSIVYWRGALSGAYWPSPDGRQKPQKSDFLKSSSTFSRPRAVAAYAKCSWTDIKLISSFAEEIDFEHQELYANKSSLTEHLQNRYILSITGNDVASSLYWITFSNSLAIKEESLYETLADYFLVPWRDYVPCMPHMVDLENKFTYLEKNLDECVRIIKNANQSYKKMLDKELWEKSLNMMYSILKIKN